MRQINQRGIAIGPILFIVAILAVLAAAIAAGSGSFSGDTSAVKLKAQATAILGYVNELQIGVDRVLSRCPDTEISLANSVDSGYAENPLAPSDKSCHVFDVNGGGILFKEPPPDVDLTSVPESLRHYFIHTNAEVVLFGNTLIGTTSAGRDLIIVLPGLKRELCLNINNILGVPMKNEDAPNANNVPAKKVYDYWTSSSNGWHISCSYSPIINSINSCCVRNDINGATPALAGSYVFFHVLHAR